MQKILNATYGQGMRITVDVDGHSIPTDLPEAKGGTNEAPDPFVLFLASLTSCTAVFAKRFCDEREIPTEGMAVRAVCELTEDPVRLETMALELTLPEGFPEKYRKAVLRAVDQCTVKKHLVEPFEIVTRLAE